MRISSQKKPAAITEKLLQQYPESLAFQQLKAAGQAPTT
jgi:hypothetical protein